MTEREMTITEVLEYEIAGAWWPQWISWGWLQDIGARYLAWKVNRKYARYVNARRMTERVLAKRHAQPPR